MRNLSICSKIIWNWHFAQNFPPVPEMISKIQSAPSSLGYGTFSSNGLRKYAIWVYVENIWALPFCSEFPPGSKMLSKIQYDPSPFGYSVFFLQTRTHSTNETIYVNCEPINEKLVPQSTVHQWETSVILSTNEKLLFKVSNMFRYVYVLSLLVASPMNIYTWPPWCKY